MGREMKQPDVALTQEEIESTFSNADKYRFMELGSTGLNRYGNDVFEEFLPQLKGSKKYEVFTEMSQNDPVVSAVIYMCDQLVRHTDWTVQAASESEADKAAAKFLEECMNDMEHSWEDFISEVLSMLIYGWSFHEVVYKVRKGPREKNGRYKSNYTDGRIGWRKMPPRAQDSLFGWVFDEDSNDVLGVIFQGPPYFKQYTIPISKGLHFRTKSTKMNPEGLSLLRGAYRPWYFKKRIEEIEGIGIERDLAGLPVLIPPETLDIWDETSVYATKARAYGESVVRNVRRDTTEGVLIPYGWDFKLLSTGGARQFDTNAIINRYDHRIAMTLLADVILLGSNGGTGSFALAEVKESLLATALEAQCKSIASVINNQAVKKLFEYNYFEGITEIPKIVPGQIETPSLEVLGTFFRNVGLKLDDDFALMNHVRKIASMPELTEEQFKEIQAKRESLRAQTENATQGRAQSVEGSDAKGENASPKARVIEDKEEHGKNWLQDE